MPVILTGLCAEFNPCFRLLSTKEQSNRGPNGLSSTLASEKKDHFYADHLTCKVDDVLDFRYCLDLDADILQHSAFAVAIGKHV